MLILVFAVLIGIPLVLLVLATDPRVVAADEDRDRDIDDQWIYCNDKVER